MSGSYLTGIFGNSPVKPMQQHMDKVFACVSELIPFAEAVLANDLAAMSAAQEKIATLENEADDLKKELRLHLPNRLFMPVPRRDLLEVLTMQDYVANQAKDIAGLMLGREMKLPEVIANDYLQFVTRCVDACAQARRAINELDELFETGFGNNEIELIDDMLKELDAIERETDDIQVKIRSALFGVEKDLPPVDVMFYYRVIDWTGDLADRAQRVGSRLQLMLAR
ncbi:MAG: TIGR00153 family protein [Pseudomonadota bacterium]